MRNTNNKQKRAIKVFFPKWEKHKGLKGFENTNKVSASTILVNGLLVTCLILSVASGLVDIVTYSGLSVSTFHLGTLPIAASILYTVISIGLISMKFWCAMKLGMLILTKNALHAHNYHWANNLNKAIIPWQIAHKSLIVISLITAMSMTTNSIGAGIRKMQQNIDNMAKDETMLRDLNESVNKGIKDKREATKTSIRGNITARDDAKQEVDRYYSKLVQYQNEYFAIDENDTEGRQKVVNKIVGEIPGATAKNAIYFTKADLQKSIQDVANKNEAVEDAKMYEEDVEYDKSQIEDTLRAIVDKEYRTPNGELISFLNEDGELINVQLAISRLQMGISEWQSDTGDVGESSKVFTLIATYFKADTKAGGMGVAEWLILGFLFFSCILQEFCIKLSTPSARIDRNTLGSVAHCLRFENKQQREDFLLDCYDDDLAYHNITKEQYDALCKECYEILGETREQHRARIMGLNKPIKRSKTEPKVETLKSTSITTEPKQEVIEPEKGPNYMGGKIGDLIDEVDNILESKD